MLEATLEVLLRCMGNSFFLWQASLIFNSHRLSPSNVEILHFHWCFKTMNALSLSEPISEKAIGKFKTDGDQETKVKQR